MIEHISINWILKMDAVTGEAIPFQFPFALTYEGWLDIIGIENGVFCIRYFEDRSPSRLASWNPLTNRGQSFHDPLQQHCNGCAYLYAFAYFPDSVQYILLHISNTDENTRIVYCLSFGGYQEDENPPYIVSFSIVDCTFDQIELPLGAVSHCQSLLVHHGELCMAANDHDKETFGTDGWQFNQGDRSWTYMYWYTGQGPSYRPYLIVHEDKIQIMERHMGVFGVHHINLTHFDITRYNVATGDRETL
ncbi:hypothetical protein PIB30_074812 [Stylosanthes scabra]|uniref:F-box associated domain-containing protein n=1 Tax=Stylosanthes scabra TaxID=79078 RepID=A0ABU6XSD1_9FABA|nr:hypothetical protein [Stylosanthes scabra]